MFPFKKKIKIGTFFKIQDFNLNNATWTRYGSVSNSFGNDRRDQKRKMCHSRQAGKEEHKTQNPKDCGEKNKGTSFKKFFEYEIECMCSILAVISQKQGIMLWYFSCGWN